MRVFAVLVALSLGLTGLVHAQTGVKVDLNLDQDQFLPDEDVWVTLRVSNRSGQTLELGKEADWVTFTIQRDNNTIAVRLGDMPVAGEFSVNSGQYAARRFNVTPWFNFRQPGRYRVTATTKVPQWGSEVASRPASFSVMNGVPLANLPNLEFGVPSGASNAVPEVRKYVLQKAAYLKELKLYFRLTDASGERTFRVYPIGTLVSFSKPEAQIDRASNLHVLHQYGAREFSYSVINPEGQTIAHQTYEYTMSRPVLRADADGKIFVSGGARRFAASDLPSPSSKNTAEDVIPAKP
jgi:hypothetical protein